MKIILSILLISTSILGFSQGDITKEFKYANFIKYYNSAIKNYEKGDISKTKSAIKNCRYSAKSLITKGFKKTIQPKLDKLTAIELEIKNGASGGNSPSSSTSSKAKQGSSSPVPNSSGDVTKEFKYSSFIKSCGDAQSFYEEGQEVQSKNSIKNARYAAKTLIKDGFKSQIQSKLAELDNLEEKINGEATEGKESTADYATISHWESYFKNVYNFPDYYTLENLKGKMNNPGSRHEPFNKAKILALIAKVKNSSGYKNGTSSTSNTSSGKTKIVKQRPSSSAKGLVDTGKVDRLEKYLNNVSSGIDKISLGKTLSTMQTSSNSSDFDLNYKQIKSFLDILFMVDNSNAYLSKVKSIIEPINASKAKVLKQNSALFNGVKTVGNKSSLPTSAQANAELDALLIGNLIMPGNKIKNIIFIDGNWKTHKDNSGAKFSQTLATWVTFIDRNGTCYLKHTTFVQYFSGAAKSDIMVYKNGGVYTASCSQVESLYVKSGKSKLPTALLNDASLSTKLKAAAKQKFVEGQTVTSVILSTKTWGTNKDYNGRIISRSRMAVATYRKSGKCYYQYHLFKQNYNGSSYGAAFIQKTLGDKMQFDCTQLE